MLMEISSSCLKAETQTRYYQADLGLKFIDHNKPFLTKVNFLGPVETWDRYKYWLSLQNTTKKHWPGIKSFEDRLFQSAIVFKNPKRVLF